MVKTFLWEPLTWYQVVAFFVVLGGLMFFNEISRRSKWFSFAYFLVLPTILTFAVWTKTAVPGSSVGTWFHWAKVYSVLAGCLGFAALRYIKGVAKNKYFLLFPPFILALNILEAVIRDFQVSKFNGFIDGMQLVGGPWNVMNAIAGILNIITISGWMGIYISDDGKRRDVVYPDQLWFWIIAYDLWNFAYVYNCVPEHSFYAGAALLLSCTIPNFLKSGKGVWLQHRGHTLATWMMFVMTFPTLVDESIFAVKSSHNTTALLIVSSLSLLSNILVFIYHYYRVIKYKINILKGEEVYKDLKAYKEVISLRRPVEE